MISFAIPAHNEERLIGAVVRAIGDAARACGVEFDITVADDASTDATARIAAEAGARVVRIERRQIAASRNAAARASAGERLVFVDGDTVLTAEALRGIVAAFEAGAAGGGTRIKFDGRIPLWARIVGPVATRMLWWSGYTGGACLFCRREVFDAVGGFDETVYASEEIWFAKAVRQHGRFVVVREPVVTSARKLRSFSGWETLWLMTRMALRGPGSVNQREGLELWYGPRREDPGSEIEQAGGAPPRDDARR
ncbi:MAG: glycosyltransferase [Phycisphaerales bacterium]